MVRKNERTNQLTTAREHFTHDKGIPFKYLSLASDPDRPLHAALLLSFPRFSPRPWQLSFII